MTNCVRKSLAILSLFVSFTNCIASDFLPIKKKSVFAASSLNGIRLLHNSHGFAINNNGRSQPVQSYDVDPQLRSITPKQLAAFIKNDGRFVVNKLGDDYSVRMGGGLKGGGPIAGAIGYWITKTFCYGTAVAAAGTAVAATGGAAGALGGAAITAATSGATLGTAVTAGAIAGAGLATEATMATAAVVTSAGGIAGAIAAVESASIGVGAILTACPFLP